MILSYTLSTQFTHQWSILNFLFLMCYFHLYIRIAHNWTEIQMSIQHLVDFNVKLVRQMMQSGVACVGVGSDGVAGEEWTHHCYLMEQHLSSEWHSPASEQSGWHQPKPGLPLPRCHYLGQVSHSRLRLVPHSTPCLLSSFQNSVEPAWHLLLEGQCWNQLTVFQTAEFPVW